MYPHSVIAKTLQAVVERRGCYDQVSYVQVSYDQVSYDQVSYDESLVHPGWFGAKIVLNATRSG